MATTIALYAPKKPAQNRNSLFARPTAIFPTLDEAKWRVSRWVRRYDQGQTAYQRLLASGQLNRTQAARLREQYESLDPFQLAEEIEKRLKKSVEKNEDTGCKTEKRGRAQKWGPESLRRWPRPQGREFGQRRLYPIFDRAPASPCSSAWVSF